MQRLTFSTFIAMLMIVCVGIAGNSNPATVSPTGVSDLSGQYYLDDLGDIIRTIPSPLPGSASNALVGMAYADGMLIVVENVYPSSVPSKFIMVDPADGTILGEVNFPFNGYCMGITYDGNNLWVVQWSPINVIYQVGLDGSLISQFTPATGSYSCRSVNAEGGNLWVGANAGSNDTKLYKMTTTGAILEEYNTGSVVGWYMGGEIDTQYPTGFNLFVVDNVGNSIKQLSTAGGTVTVMDQFASPAVIAEGLTFDGEYLWHCCAYATAGVLWCFDDGMAGTPPDVTVTVVPIGVTSFLQSQGGLLEWNIAGQNNETTTQTVDIWCMLRLPDASYFGPVMGPVLGFNMPGSWGSDRDRDFNIPPDVAPVGTYQLVGYIGDYPDTPWAEDEFNFEVTAGDGIGHPGTNLWFGNGSGEDFRDLLPQAGVAAVPETFSMTQNYPNPFNPATTIEFSLNQADFVELSVFDVTGRHVTTLVDGFRDAGTHEVTFDAAGMATGLYVYRLTSGAQIAVGKMILMK